MNIITERMPGIIQGDNNWKKVDIVEDLPIDGFNIISIDYWGMLLYAHIEKDAKFYEYVPPIQCVPIINTSSDLHKRAVWSGLPYNQNLITPYFKDRFAIPEYTGENPITYSDIVNSSNEEFISLFTGLLSSYDMRTGRIYRYFSDNILMAILTRLYWLSIPVSLDWYKIRPVIEISLDTVMGIINKNLGSIQLHSPKINIINSLHADEGYITTIDSNMCIMNSIVIEK